MNAMHPIEQARLHLTRREFFGRTATGIGTVRMIGLEVDDPCQGYGGAR